MSRRPTRGRRRGGRDKSEMSIWPILGIGLVVLGFVALLFAVLWQRSTATDVDAETLCPKAGPSALTVILVDATDDMTPVQKTAVATNLQEVVAGLREFEQVQVIPIDPGLDPLKPGFRVCRPPSPEQTSDWTGSKALARLRFEKVFQPKLKAVLDQAVDRPPSASSPIMEAIQAVVVGSFQKADAAAGHPLPKHLVIVSDMLENGAGGSHYKGAPQFAAFRQTDAYNRLRAHMEGIEVKVLYLSRPDARAVQGRVHSDFWQDYFHDQDARPVSFYWIEG